MKKLLFRNAIIISLVCLLLGSTQSLSEAQWTTAMETEFQMRSKEVITKLAGSNYGTTSFESEKKSYPKAMIDFLAGNKQKAIAFLQSEDADAESHSHTLGIDFYSSFTLKGQVRKYFYFGKYLDPAYRQRMKRAMKIFTEFDPLDKYFPTQRKFWANSIDNCNSWVDCRNTDNLKAMRVTGKIKLQYQGEDLPKVWRNGQFHDWHLNHYAVYQNVSGSNTPIHLGWKEGKLIVEAGGYKFQNQL